MLFLKTIKILQRIQSVGNPCGKDALRIRSRSKYAVNQDGLRKKLHTCPIFLSHTLNITLVCFIFTPIMLIPVGGFENLVARIDGREFIRVTFDSYARIKT